MSFLKYGSVSLLFLFLGAPGFAQSAPPENQSAPAADEQPAPTETQPSARAQRRRGFGAPCWKQAGMTPQMVNQKWQIEEQQKQSIAAVCSDQSTGPQQKHDKIEQIHANTAQDLAKLIPAEELAKFNRCEADLKKSRPSSGQKKEVGPCGGTIPAAAGSEHGMEHHH